MSAIYLSNAASWRRDHGPGRKWLIMAIPPDYSGERWGVCLAGMPPSPQHVAGVRSGRIPLEDYRAQCAARWAGGAAHLGPGRLSGYDAVSWYCDRARQDRVAVADGDTLLCGCARIGGDNWTRPCHRQWLAWYLAATGWAPVLDGRPCRWTTPPALGGVFDPDPVSHRSTQRRLL